MTHGRIATESDEYKKSRDELLEAEIALRGHIERVAALRRQLPLDTAVEDYVFHEGPADLGKDGPITEVRLSQLFTDPGKPLVMYQYMFGGAQKRPCPMCTMWVDGFNGVARHLRPNLNFAVIAQAGIGEFREWGRHRGWNGLRLVSSQGTAFKTVLQFEDSEQKQWPGLNVFMRSPDGSVKHFYSQCAEMTPVENRGIDLMSPVWNLLDLTPQGRGDWLAKLEY